MTDSLAKDVVDTLRDRGLTLATCETDTGGLIGSRITDIPGCSAVFIGGIVPYHNPPKLTLAAVDRDILKMHGSVSEEAAIALAHGARAALKTDLAIAETGITGPTGGSAERPVGTVWIACAGPGDRIVAELHVWDGDRITNKQHTADRALEMLLEAARDTAG
ncbi:MAG: CinA family protein [Chloroflexi bacterium]|nr:CinA family protein [Chloroflexota bacterium]